METMDLLQKIDCLLHKVEGLLRGNSTAGVVIELRKDCFEFLELMSKDNIEDFSKQLEPLVKKEALKSVIRLHNKCRNLTQTAALQELKNLIKMICSIIMIITGEQKNKVLAVAVKILCKAGQEMMTTDLPKEIILRCLVTAVATWQEACELMIQRELPALEVQDVTAAVFWAYCSKGCVIYEMGKGLGLARAEFAAAFAMVQSLPLDLKVAFATNILQFCRNAIKGPDGSDTNMVALLEMGLNCIESAMLEQDTLHEEADNDQDGVESLISRKKPVQEIRFQILLSLIFVHIQLRYVVLLHFSPETFSISV